MKQVQLALLFAATCLSSLSVMAQVSETSFIINNEKRNAVMLTINQPDKEIREALRLRLERSGLKEKLSGNVSIYKGVMLRDISSDRIDMYTKVEAGPYNTSVVYMAVARKYNNFSPGGYDSSLTKHVKLFLQSFLADLNDRSTDTDISGMMDDISKEEKFFQQLLDNQAELQKKRLLLDDQLLEIQNNLYLKKEMIDKKKVAVQLAKSRKVKPL
ncbi:hypothetical protein HHL16_16950 [Pseudoflavitalea sp. G-6-1-2]|uniref:hypothetical protein n=1 Tax=Pseudoflavitalea sp. G-6-1-2 TaxID=2728841 RepID=UPI00146D4574|nr:hypothetical protein [Pseudoflavitalea sp. G-6-1-2]NML22573.1 hypothetical protein [Pseudoflavitalea sp. G-6-1-2]